MTTIREGVLEFVFGEGWRAGKYDRWQFYLTHFQNVCGGTKAVDIVAVHEGRAWLLEVKDFRVGPRGEDKAELWDEVAAKVRDTLAGLVAARLHATADAERDLASLSLECIDLKVVLHLEQPLKPTRLHPVYDVTLVTQKLKQLLRKIDDHPRVVSLSDPSRFRWTVREVPAT